MRSIIASIIVLLMLTTPVWSMQDDSGLKEFRIDAKDMLGVVDEFPTEDTKSSFQYDNFLYSPSGIFTLPNVTQISDGGVGTGVQLPVGRVYTSLIESGNNGAYLAAIYNGSTEIYFVTSGNAYLLTTETNIINPQLLLVTNGYNGTAYTYLVTGNNFYKTAVNSPSSITTITTPWETAVASTLWQSRIFVAERYTIGINSFQNRLWWSSASNIEDWTKSATAGGYVDLPLSEEIISIQGTLQGLVVLTNLGAYVISGPTAENWQTEKVFSNRNDPLGTLSNFNFDVAVRDNTIAFIDRSSNFNMLQNLQLNRMGRMPGVGFGGKLANGNFLNIWSGAQWDNRYTIIPISSYGAGATYLNEGYALVYDMDIKSWYKFTEIAAVSESYLITSSGMLYSRPDIKPKLEAGKWTSRATIQTAPQTFNLDNQSCKDVVRIEVDCKTVNGSTFEISLISDTATVSKTFTSSTNNMASYVFYPKIGSACRSYSLKFQAPSGCVLKSVRCYYINRGNLKVQGGK